jgi:hypothetical protein
MNTTDCLQTNIAVWAVREAEDVMRRNGPQEFFSLRKWIAAAAEDVFHGAAGFSRRRVVRDALEEAAKNGRWVVAWKYNAKTRCLAPGVVRLANITAEAAP